MDKLVIPIEFMKIGYIWAIPMVITYFLTIRVKKQYAKPILYLMKMLSYLGLAGLMWKYYQTKIEIDVVSAFTFIFCCLEAADNFISLMSILVEN